MNDLPVLECSLCVLFETIDWDEYSMNTKGVLEAHYDLIILTVHCQIGVQEMDSNRKNLVVHRITI